MRWIYLSLGVFFVGLGVLGVLLPGIPTTPFILLASGCFAKSSPKLYNWLNNHSIFGPPLGRWRQGRVIPWSAKLIAWLGMSFGIGLTLISPMPVWFKACAAVLGLYGAYFVASCPSQLPSDSKK